MAHEHARIGPKRDEPYVTFALLLALPIMKRSY